MTGVDHQPLKVSVVHQGLQNLFPDSLVTPPAEPAVYIFPVSIRLWQVPPRCSSTQYPEYTVDKLPSIPGVASSCPFFTDGVRSDFLPRFVIDVMPLLFCCHFSAPFFFEDYYITFLLTTPSKRIIIKKDKKCNSLYFSQSRNNAAKTFDKDTEMHYLAENTKAAVPLEEQPNVHGR